MNEVSISLLNPIELRWTHSPGHAEEGPEVRPGLSGELHGVVVEDAEVAVRGDDGEVLSTRRERELVDGARRRRGIRGGLIRRGRGATRRRPDRPSVQGIPGFQRHMNLLANQISSFISITVVLTDSHPTLYMVHGRAKPVLHGETTYRVG